MKVLTPIFKTLTQAAGSSLPFKHKGLYVLKTKKQTGGYVYVYL